MSTILTIQIWHLKQFERWKGSIRGCLVSWLKFFLKIIVLKSFLLLFYAKTTNHFSIRLWHATKFILYNQQWPLSRRSSKALSKSLSLSGGLLVWSTRTFWIPAKLLYLRSTLMANLWDAHKTAMPAASTGQQNGPNSPLSAQPRVAQPKLQKLNELGYKDLPHPLYPPRLSPMDYHFFKHLDDLCRENTPTAGRRQKILAKVCWILKLGFLHYRNKQKFLGKNMLITVVPILINKDVFKPNYNWKFIV